MEWRVDRYSIRKAKKKLYRFLPPIFEDYFEKILKISGSLQVIEKILNKDISEPQEISIVAKLRRMGIIRPMDADYKFVDPFSEGTWRAYWRDTNHRKWLLLNIWPNA